MDVQKIKLPEGWEVDKIENGEIILRESGKGFPKTWEECYQRIGSVEYIGDSAYVSELEKSSKPSNENKNEIPRGLGKPLLALMQLLICRDVYRKGWKPTSNDECYCICNCEGTLNPASIIYCTRVLSFQSEEVRDEFLNNFRDLIEEAKELI